METARKLGIHSEAEGEQRRAELAVGGTRQRVGGANSGRGKTGGVLGGASSGWSETEGERWAGLVLSLPSCLAGSGFLRVCTWTGHAA